ncbi:MAG: cellulase family glycosylhydrolase [Halanaerobiales bacterium]
MIDFSKIRGFNYQPSYGSTSFENWIYFDSEKIELELRRGKQYFPDMNTIRLWLSWEAYRRNPEKFVEDFEIYLKITDRLDLKVVPTLFNRWHNSFLDNGGVYLDHIIKGWSWASRDRDGQFSSYVSDVVTPHLKDTRILAWDICNEPFSYDKPLAEMKEIEGKEYKWLEGLYGFIKELDPQSSVGISLHAGHGKKGLERVLPISDILFIHPYFIADQDDEKAKAAFRRLLDDYVDVRERMGKPLLVTETCWGSLDNKWRIENIKFTLTELKERKIAWLVHALHHSLVADLHTPEYGPVGEAGYMAFINADGTLREGHQVFNDF